MNDETKPYSNLDLCKMEAIDKLLVTKGVSLVPHETNPYVAKFLDCEGELIAEIQEDVADSILELEPHAACDLLHWVYLRISAGRASGYRRGVSDGRKAICDTVQELLGIDKITDALVNQERNR